MREIGIIAREEDAKVLADFLLTRDITTKLVPGSSGSALWVHREDKVPEAREWLAEFQANPSDPRFYEASKAAREIRKLVEKKEREHAKLTKNFRERWEGSMYHRAPLSFGLIVPSVVVFIVMSLNWQLRVWIFDLFNFSVQVTDADGRSVDTGFQSILSGQVWRLITPIFLHIDLLHIFCNMMAMRYLAERVEMQKGTLKFAILVVVSAILSNAGESLLMHTPRFGGMSGVVFAITGYLWIKGYTDPEDHLSLDERNVQLMLGWFLLGIFMPMIPEPMRANVPSFLGIFFHMANIAHGVGLATGVVFGLLRF